MNDASLINSILSRPTDLPSKPRKDRPAARLLDASARFWFVVAVIGQWTFGLYVTAVFGITSVRGDLAAWNRHLPHGYEAGNPLGNAMLAMHLLFAAIIMFCGPLQLVPSIRLRFPKFHRITGRVYVATAVIMALSGLYLSLSGRKVIGDLGQNISIVINGLLILACAYMAINAAIKRKFAAHRRWALRLFVAASGVWFFRLGLMSWLVVNGGPVGFDPKTFTGPFLTALSWTVYVFDLLLLEVYLRAHASKSDVFKGSTALLVTAISIAMAIGVFGATMGLWLQRVLHAIG